MPKGDVYYLENINRTSPKNMEDVVEPLVRDKFNLNRSIKNQTLTSDFIVQSGIRDYVKENGKAALEKLILESGYENVFEYAQAR